MLLWQVLYLFKLILMCYFPRHKMPNTHINDASELKYKSTHSKITASLQSIAECHRHLNRNVNEHNNKNLVYYWTLCKNVVLNKIVTMTLLVATDEENS